MKPTLVSSLSAFSSLSALAAVTAVLATGATPAVAATPRPSPGAGIVGGHDATEAYPAMASVQFDRGAGVFGHTCAATLVTVNRVTAAVTGAHCVTADDGTALPTHLFRLRVGSPMHNAGGTLVDVRKIVVHPDWAWGQGPGPVADVAVLVPATPLPVSGIAITEYRTATTVRILGWGSTKTSGEGPLPDMVQELDTLLLDRSACAGDAGLPITAGEVCVNGGNGAGACFGDSGGPALQRNRAGTAWTVLGGASRETAPTCGTNPVIYTDLRAYRTFIHDAITGCLTARPHRPTLRRDNRTRWATTK